MTKEHLAVSELILDAAISKAIEDKRELLNPSMLHFIGGGKVNGEFDIAIKKLMRWVEKKTGEAMYEYAKQPNTEKAIVIWNRYMKNLSWGETQLCQNPGVAAMEEYATLQCEAKDKEIERLKGLVKTAYWALPDHRNVSKQWQQFKTENNIL